MLLLSLGLAGCGGMATHAPLAAASTEAEVRDPDLDVHPDPRVGLLAPGQLAHAVNRVWAFPGALR